MSDTLAKLDQYTGYTLMKHTYEPRVKYRLQIWHMNDGANIPHSHCAWGETPEQALENCQQNITDGKSWVETDR